MFLEALGQVAVHKTGTDCTMITYWLLDNSCPESPRSQTIHSLTIFTFKMCASATWSWSVFVLCFNEDFPDAEAVGWNATYFYTMGIHLWSDVCAALSFPTVEGMRDAAGRNGLLSFSWFKLPNLSSCTCSFEVPLMSWWFCFRGSMGRGRLSPANCEH